jgi:hypothetical protein
MEAGNFKINMYHWHINILFLKNINNYYYHDYIDQITLIFVVAR